MLFYTGLLLLVIAVSIDGLGVGLSYGIQKTRVPFQAILIIIFCSGLTVLLAMTIGDAIETFLSSAVSEMMGGIILILLGLFALSRLLRNNKQIERSGNGTNALSDVKIVLASPVRADLDKSGYISISEAILLGLALALDAFGAGIAASFLHYSPLLTASLIAMMSGAFLIVGTKLGILLTRYPDKKYLSFLPPFLLIGIGIIHLFN